MRPHGFWSHSNHSHILIKLRTCALGAGGPFSALSHRNYRLLWIGTLVSHSGDWMDQIALNWLVLELTGSPFYLGLANLCRGIPILLFTLLGGVAADRLERRKLMLITQSFAMLLALLLATLVQSGRITIWLVLVLITLRGVMISFNLPARHSLISELVPQKDLPNAIALTSMTMNLTKIIGPALGGVIIGTLGTAASFYINGLSFLAVLWTLWSMNLPEFHHKTQHTSLGQSLTEGFQYIRGDRTIAILVLIALVPAFFGRPYMTMLAVFAHDVLAIGATGLGLLTACAALGSIIGALLVGSLRTIAMRGIAMLLFMIAFGAFLIVFAYSIWPLVSAVLIIGVGAMHMAYNVSNNTILQMRVPDEYRGHVLSTLFLNRGLVSLGTALTATLASLIGPSLAVALMGAMIILMGIGVMILAPTFRHLKV